MRKIGRKECGDRNVDVKKSGGGGDDIEDVAVERGGFRSERKTR